MGCCHSHYVINIEQTSTGISLHCFGAVLIFIHLSKLSFYTFQNCFIGYGGNVVREAVKQQAPWFVTDFGELISVLQESS